MSEYFPKPKSSRANVKVELDLSNYATNADLKNVTGVDTAGFYKKTDLANLKSDVDRSDIDKLKRYWKLDATPVDLTKLSNVKNDVVKKTEYKEVNSIQTSYTSNLV